MQEVGRGEDRIAWVPWVSPEAVGPPSRGEELHWPHGAGNAPGLYAPECRLHEVDGGENLPSNAEPPLCRPVVAEELRERVRRPGANAVRRPSGGQAAQVAEGGVDLTGLVREGGRQAPDGCRSQAGTLGKEAVGSLDAKGISGHIAGG
jgi:hypothetical protein